MSVDKFIEFMNLYLALFDLCVMTVLSAYLVRVYKVDTAAHLAIGLLIYVTGHCWVRGWTWLQWYATNHANAPAGPSWYEDPLQIPMFSTGIIITTIGLIYILRLLVSTLNRWIWYLCVLAVTLVAAAVTWI